MKIVYVTAEHPVTTQTFVEAEIEALRRLGDHVVSFPLHGRPLFSVVGPSGVERTKVAASAARAARLAPAMGREVFRSLRNGERSSSSVIRQLFAGLRGLELAAMLDSAAGSCDDYWVHAHFLGRTLEVATYAQATAASIRDVSATAHAADAFAPATPRRLRSNLGGTSFVACASRPVEAAVLRITEAQSNRPSTALIHVGIEPAPTRTHDRDTDDPLRVISVARLVEKKGLDDAVAAAKLLDERGISFHWDIIGDGPLAPELHTAASTLVERRMMTFHGHLAHDDVLQMLSSSMDLFVLPCKQAQDGDVDGIPTAMVEAMTRGLLVVTCDVGGIGDLVRDQETGVIVQPSNSHALACAIQSTLSDPSAAAGIADKGKAFADAHFHRDTEAQKLRQLMINHGASL